MSAGVEALARLLLGAAEAPSATVAEIAAREGIARSTAFDIVRRMEEAGLAMRGAGGDLAPGDRAVELGFAAHGIAHLHGPAEAALAWLKETLGMAAAFGIGEGEGRIELAAIPAPRGRAVRPVTTMTERAGEVWIEVQVPTDASEQLVEAAKRNLRRAAAALV